MQKRKATEKIKANERMMETPKTPLNFPGYKKEALRLSKA